MTATHNPADKILLDFSVNNGFTQLVNDATRNDNVLDILLVNEPNTVFDVHVGPPFGGSDHYCVNFTVVVESTLLSEFPNDTVTNCSKGTKRYRWQDANYAALAEYLSTYDWNHLFSVNLSVDSMWSAFCNVVGEAVDANVPVYSVNSHTTKKWYPKKYVKQRHARTVFGISRAVIPIIISGSQNTQKLPGSLRRQYATLRYQRKAGH